MVEKLERGRFSAPSFTNYGAFALSVVHIEYIAGGNFCQDSYSKQFKK